MKWSTLCFLALLVACSTPSDNDQVAKSKPNILFIMIDDLGWMDVGYQNPEYHTPNIDQLVKEGMVFTDAYAAAPVCSPTRAAAMTGLSPARLQITNHIPDRWRFYTEGDMGPGKSVNELDPKYRTIAERLKEGGYATGFIGKWHLSGAEFDGLPAEYLPTNHGFDINIAGCSRGGPGGEGSFFDPYTIPTIENRQEGEYLPDRLADEAVAYMAAQAETENPFFLCLWNYTVHWPVEAPEYLVEKYAPEGNPSLHQTFQAMVEGMDIAVGKVLASLDSLGLAENTLVVFTSDNGPFTGDVFGEITTTTPLKDDKGHLSEGGIRVPLVIRWPGKIEPGSVSDEPVVTMDFVPTFLDASEAPYQEQKFDGESLVPIFKGEELQRSSIFFHFPHYAFHQLNTMGSAIRRGDYKLIYHHLTEEVELYNLKDDIGESRNLATSSPEQARELLIELKDWMEETNAQLPRLKSEIVDDELYGKRVP